MSEVIQWITANWDTVLEIAVQVVGVAALVATVTPSETDNKIVAKISKVLNFLGANFGKAKNDGRSK